MAQTEVTDMTVSVAGMLADDGQNKDVIGYTSEEASAGIRPGVMVKQGAADFGALLLAATTDKLIGVAVYGQAYARPEEIDDDGYQPLCTFDVLVKGRVWVLTETDWTPGAQVHVRVTSEVAGDLGQFLNAKDGAKSMDVSKFCRFMNSGTGTANAPGLALVSIDMTMAANATADS